MKKITEYIDEGYKIMRFERDVDLLTGQEIGKIEMKGLNGGVDVVTVDDNSADDIEKKMFNYLLGK